MHLLAATPGAINDGSEAIDLNQTPGDIVVLSAADTELSSLAEQYSALPDENFTLRLANVMHLGHNLSIDIYVEDIIAQARLVIVRLLGGISYWPYGVEQITERCRQSGIKLVFLPGDDKADIDLMSLATIAPEDSHRLWQYLVNGGPENYRQFLNFSQSLIGKNISWHEPKPVLTAGLYWPGQPTPDLKTVQSNWTAGNPVSFIIFYRALFQAGNLDPINALIKALAEDGMNPLPLFVSSLKDPLCASIVQQFADETPPSVILNATGFSISPPGAKRARTPFDTADCPILQVIFSGGNEADWRDGLTGLSARDIAMNVALPEVDGRILSRAVSFKSDKGFDDKTQTSIVSYKPVPDRIAFVAALARNWARLRSKQNKDKKIALILANYPTKNGRIGNGVGLDTPAATVTLMQNLQRAGYPVRDIPTDGNNLIKRLLAGPTNDLNSRRHVQTESVLSLEDYQHFFTGLPVAVQSAIETRWGTPQEDPFFAHGNFHLSAIICGETIIGIQPARGYHIDPVRSYHDPDLVPPHGYLAFYAWLRHLQKVDAIVHMGKHGNMEWLPGKALALSEECFPEVVFGPTPHLYPFIVNDPGEGTQAKRRASAVIIDHLTPPMTRAESYGPLADLERLVDEYYDAAGLDPRRIELLRQQILELTQSTGIDKDCGIDLNENESDQLSRLDSYLCELKELQIRDGLHIFGISPEGRQLTDLLVALVRIPRGDGKNGDASLIRALAADLNLTDFDPLDCDLGQPWQGEKPTVLNFGGTWRSIGDTVERLEELAVKLIDGICDADPAWTRSAAVLAKIETELRPAVMGCGAAELAGILAGLDGRFVAPGPSGAPTRGRNDVLPTGRNFYSVDSRTIPTATAWLLGWKSADLLIDRYRQENGQWPRTLAISAWGTSNMRTGGDDIAQALALMGVRPTWETASRRVIGYEILPLSILDRPRVDVTLRVSGFFRDAFPQQMALFDSAVRAVAELDEEAHDNPLAARVAQDMAEFQRSGMDEATARQKAGYRLFGSKPGAYGAGLQALIDEKGWDSAADLGAAYIAWGGYAYGAGEEGKAEHGLFRQRLGQVQAVIHNQDNREHDLLDSDDYYQFEGGMTAAIEQVSGARPIVYHNDHSRPESPKIRTLEEEIGRVVRARVVNPKWIEGVMRHGYKGAFEMAATVDYMFAFAATTGAVKDHHFDAVFEAYLLDEKVRQFLADNNPDALREIAQRLDEAMSRNLWRPRWNTTKDQLHHLMSEEKP